MKHALKFMTGLALCLALTACNNKEKKQATTLAPLDASISKIEVLDFHSTHRCMTCNAIEANAKYTLDNHFAKELQEGLITWQVVNVDEKKNEQIAEKFEASGTALILNVIKNGKESKIDLTDFAFMKGNDKAEFSEELRVRIDKELNTL